jgi:hypothetical protein
MVGGLGFRVYGVWCMVYGAWFRVQSLGYRREVCLDCIAPFRLDQLLQGLGLRVLVFGFLVSGLESGFRGCKTQDGMTGLRGWGLNLIYEESCPRGPRLP